MGTPTQTAGVTAGAITAVGFDYDQAATIDATLTATGGGTLPASTWSQIPIVLGNTAFLPSGTKEFTGTGTFRTLASLFPSSTGYTALAGDCADADERRQPGVGDAERHDRCDDPARRPCAIVVHRERAPTDPTRRGCTTPTAAARAARPRRSAPSPTASAIFWPRCRTARGRSRCPATR